MNHRRLPRLAAMISAGLILAACGREPERQPASVDDALPVADTSDLRLPTSYQDLEVVQPNWDMEPQYADGIYLAGADTGGMLEFTAVDITGDALWSAERPVSCTGFTVTIDADGRAVAILTDAETSDEALAEPTATGYDLATGEELWGPVDVPGPYQGPGSIFAAPPEGFMGETGPRTVLDPSSGEIAAREIDADVDRIIGEYDGVILLVDDENLVARQATTGQDQWTIELADHDWLGDDLRPVLEPEPGDGLAVIQTDQDTRALIDLEEGAVVNDTVLDAEVDVTTGSLVVIDDTGLHVVDSAAQSQWSLGTTAETSIAAAGGVLLYLRDDDAVRVHNITTGQVAQGYDSEGQGQIAVPTHITASGAALLSDGHNFLLATVEDQPPEPSTDDAAPGR